MSFSWVTGEPIARVMSGRYSNKKIRYNPDANTKDRIECVNPFNFLSDKWFRERKKKLTTLELNTLYQCLINKTEPRDEDLYDLYKQASEYLEQSCQNELTLDDGTLQVLPPAEYKVADKSQPKQTSRVFVAGPTGSGKSTWCANYIKEIIRQRRCKYFYIFSNLNDDTVLDDIKPHPKRIQLDKSIVDNPIKLEELKDSVVLFDDIDAIKDDDIRKTVAKLRDESNAEGRHFNIFTLSTGHNLLNYRSTRNLLSDCSHIVFFPRSGGDYFIQSFLKKYCGSSKNETEKIMNLPSRWVCIKKTYPVICFHSAGAFLMGKDNNKVSKPKVVKEEEVIVPIIKKAKAKKPVKKAKKNSPSYTETENSIATDSGTDNSFQSDYSSDYSD